MKTDHKLKTIEILVPVFNEEEMVHLFHEKVCEVIDALPYEFKFLFVNDGSTDETVAQLKQLRAKDNRVHYLVFSRNYGKETAMAAGFDYVDADAVLVIDADLQDPPELIPKMIELLEQGYDDAYGQRTSRKGESFLKILTSKLFYILLDKFSKVPIQKDTGDFRLLSRRAVEALKQYRESERYTKGFFSLVGFKKKAVPYEREPRAAGTTKWNYLKLIDLAIEGISSFSAAPLRFATVLGVLVSLLAISFMSYILLKTLLFRDPVAGYPSIVCIILFLGGAQLFCLGIIGEYLGRVFYESKNRPLYFIMESSHCPLPRVSRRQHVHRRTTPFISGFKRS